MSWHHHRGVLRQETPVVISKSAFAEALSSSYGHSLFARRPIERMLSHLQQQVLHLSPSTPISTAGQRILDLQKLSLPLIVIQDSSGPALIESRNVLAGYIRIHELMEREIEASRARAQQDANFKSNFLSTMSHEIRTPLNAILGFSELISEGKSPEYAEMGGIINRSAKNLLHLLNDILDLAKIEAGKMELCLAPCDLRAQLHDCLRLFEVQALAKGLLLELVYDPALPEQILADELRIQQIILNLLSNAVKFTDHGGISITVGLLQPSAGVSIKVKDSGIGMSPEQCGRIFESFVQAEADTARKYGGTGLGTAIVKKLAALMGGGIEVSSQLGQGSVFTLELPVKFITPPPSKAPAAPAVAAPLQGRVLVVDDLRANLVLMKIQLGNLGLTVVTADNGDEAIERAAAFHPELVFLDIQMPGMDGVQTCRQLRSGGFKAPVIAFTANVLPEDQAKYLAAGFDSCLSKPAKQEEVAACVRFWLDLSRNSRTTVASLP